MGNPRDFCISGFIWPIFFLIQACDLSITNLNKFQEANVKEIFLGSHESYTGYLLKLI